MPPAPMSAMISYGPSFVPEVKAIGARHYKPAAARYKGYGDSGRMVGNPYLIALRQSCSSLGSNTERRPESVKRIPTTSNPLIKRTPRIGASQNVHHACVFLDFTKLTWTLESRPDSDVPECRSETIFGACSVCRVRASTLQASVQPPRACLPPSGADSRQGLWRLPR